MAWDPDNWRQGCTISADHLPEDNRKRDISHYLVISHDCDLARPPEQEPFVEFLPCHPATVLDGNLRNAKQARKLQLDLAVDDAIAVCVELRAFEKIFVHKETCHGMPVKRGISDDDLAVLRTWLASRYRRQAVPDSLNDGLKPFWDKFKKPASKLSHVLHGIWCHFDPQQDPTDRSDGYSCTFYFVYDADAEDAENIKNLCEQLKPAADALAEQNPPIFLELKAVPDTQFTYRMQRATVRWMHDHVSHKTGAPVDEV